PSGAAEFGAAMQSAAVAVPSGNVVTANGVSTATIAAGAIIRRCLGICNSDTVEQCTSSSRPTSRTPSFVGKSAGNALQIGQFARNHAHIAMQSKLFGPNTNTCMKPDASTPQAAKSIAASPLRPGARAAELTHTRRLTATSAGTGLPPAPQAR